MSHFIPRFHSSWISRMLCSCTATRIRALLSSELEQIFASAPANPTTLASQRVRDAYALATGASSSFPAASSSSVAASKHKNPDGEDCAICYEEMSGDQATLEKLLVWCDTCDNAVHKECFGQCGWLFFSILSFLSECFLASTDRVHFIKGPKPPRPKAIN